MLTIDPQSLNGDMSDRFLSAMQGFMEILTAAVSTDMGQWSMKGLIDSDSNVYSLSSDTKLISKVLEIQMMPRLIDFANSHEYDIIIAEKQNWYPDMSFVNRINPNVKFAVDIKSTYRLSSHDNFCNGFTLGSHGSYFRNRASTKNVQFPYADYLSHFVIGIIYSRTNAADTVSGKVVCINDIDNLQSIIEDITVFIAEKWRTASYRSGSGNTANIGSINHIPDILCGNGVFARLGEDIFDEYWINYGVLQVSDVNSPGKYRPLTKLTEFLEFKGLDEKLINVAKTKRKLKQ